jgi:hypothetical protein
MTTLENQPPVPAQSTADALNHGCFCRTLDPEQLRQEIERVPSLQGLMQTIWQTRPHLFAATAVFLTDAMVQNIAAVVAALQRVTALPGYQAQALARAPAIAGVAFGPQGACMGFDFHWSPSGPKLIEINTNAGGALLNAALLGAQVACCEPMQGQLTEPAQLEATFFEMFKAEWQLQRGDVPLCTVAIVDDDPAGQYLAPEFELFRQMFLRQGVHAEVLDPAGLIWREGQLWSGERPIDLVYNRLTDFYLDDPAHQPLRQAYTAGAVVLTPNPHAHALYADKRNLIALSDDAQLAAWGASVPDRALLQAAVPQTKAVTLEKAEDFWAQRKHLFFKPATGYGGKAAYRGDKLTKRVWTDILAGDFVAQALVPPGERWIKVDGVPTDLKFDLRAYAYDGQVQLLAARMYMGQTTNFRTEGGGFAPVIAVPGP